MTKSLNPLLLLLNHYHDLKHLGFRDFVIKYIIDDDDDNDDHDHDNDDKDNYS